MFKKIQLLFLIIIFGLSNLRVNAQSYIVLPEPGERVSLSTSAEPALLKGIKIYPGEPFRFDFILDHGNASTGKANKMPSIKETERLIKYFLAALTIPAKDMWVNLSPYEKDRIIPESFASTAMGRDLLAEDYILKQITASLIYPENTVGKIFWQRVYQEAAQRFGTTDIPVSTFNKVWIMPETASVYENPRTKTAYITNTKLKVLLEEDYLALTQNKAGPLSTVTNALGNKIIREIVIPQLTKEVNENRNFIHLRQVYNSLILASWYKKKIRNSIMSTIYVDRKKTAGITTNDFQNKEFIYRQYLEAFQKGVCNLIKEENDPATGERISRRYFSGGITWDQASMDKAMTITLQLPTSPFSGHYSLIESRLDMAMATNPALKIRIAPSILDVPDEKRLARIKESWRAGVELIHFDQMDGEFVGNTSDILPVLLASRRFVDDRSNYGMINNFEDERKAKNPPLLDVHLMMQNPTYEKMLSFVKAGADRISVHIESTNNPSDLITQLNALKGYDEHRNLQTGLVINPETSINNIKPYLKDIDFVLFMMVDPGAGGQEFKPEVLEKIRELSNIAKDQNLKIDISADGGINYYYANQLVANGATTVIAGGGIFGQTGQAYQRYGSQPATVAQAVMGLRQSISKPVLAFNDLEVTTKLFKEVVRRIKGGLLTPGKTQDFDLKLLQKIYFKRLKGIIKSQRVPLPAYYYGFSDLTDVTTINDRFKKLIQEKVIPYNSWDGALGDDGIKMTDFLMSLDELKDKVGMGPSFRKAPTVYLAFPEDIFLTVPRIIRNHIPAIFGNEFRLIGNVLIHPKKISAVIIDFEALGFNSAEEKLLMRKLEMMEHNLSGMNITDKDKKMLDFLLDIKKTGIEFLSFKQAKKESEFLFDIRKEIYPESLLKSGRLELLDIKFNELDTVPSLIKWNRLKNGEIVRVKGRFNYGYVSVKIANGQQHKYVTYLSDEMAPGIDDYMSASYKTAEISYLAGEKVAKNSSQIPLKDIITSNATIDLSDLESGSFHSLLVTKFYKTDHAMKDPDPKELIRMNASNGGIDLRNFDVDLNSVMISQRESMVIDPRVMERLGQIKGLTPVFVNIRPIVDLRDFIQGVKQ